jgi:hypothetical protein
MPEKPKTVLVFAGGADVDRDGRPDFTRGLADVPRAAAVPLDRLEQNVREFLAAAQSLIDAGAVVKGAMKLTEVQVQAQISAEGQVGFLGTGASVAAQASVSFVFRRE